MAPLNAMLLELPLLLAAFGFSAALMGLSGAHIHQMASIKDKMQNQSSLPNFVILNEDKILNVDYAMLVIGAVQFVFCLFAMLMSCEQLKKRRGEYSGKGTRGWLLIGLVQFVLLGAWTGIVAAYTAYTVQKSYSFSPGSEYSEPFDQKQRLYLRQIDYYIRSQVTGSLRLNNVPDFDLGVWNVQNLQQANAYLAQTNYLDIFSWRAAVAVGWFELGTVFLVTVVHFALPFVWKYFGLLREPKKDPASRYNDLM